MEKDRSDRSGHSYWPWPLGFRRRTRDQKTRRRSRELSESLKEDQGHRNLRSDYQKLFEQHQLLLIEKEQQSSETQALKKAIDSRERQILALQQYRTNFTRDEAQNDFRTLLGNINNWVEERTDKFIDNKALSKQWTDSLKHFPRVLHHLRQFLDANLDLASAIGYMDSDQHIIYACIVRFIMRRIFGEIPCNVPSQSVETLQMIEHTMASCTEPKIDKLAIRCWRAQAYHALFSHPKYPETRQAGIDILSTDLANIFEFLSNSPNNAKLGQSIASEIIEPSLRLYENFKRSHEEYSFETAGWIKPGSRVDRDLPRGRLRELLDNLDCTNALRHNAKFHVEKLKPQSTDEALKNQLYVICSINPALRVKWLQANDGEETETLFKEKVLVAWDPETLKGRDPSTLKIQTWLSRVCECMMG